MSGAKAHEMDPEFGYFRVTGAADESEALATALAAWPETFGAKPEYRFDDGKAPKLAVESSGWYRCQPCVCGLEHGYDIWPTQPHARGATFTYLIGWGVSA